MTCTWADFAEAIFEEAGLGCRVRRISTGRARPAGAAAGVLGPPQREGAPELPHWREGLREALAAIRAAEPAE